MITAIPFVGGIDRDTGSMVVRPGSMADLRNVIVSDGRLVVRSGMLRVQDFVDEAGQPLTHICAIHSLRAERVGLVVGYNSATGKVHIYRVTEQGTDPVLLPREDGELFWFQLPVGSPPPIIFAADSYSKVFFAHDEENIAAPSEDTVGRANTICYDQTSPTLSYLRADLDGDGKEEPVRFRGVVAYLDYLWGWGYGTEREEDRPEVLRVSLPGEPHLFDPEHYFIVGQRGDPIRNCVPTAATLVILKEAATYRTVGSSSADFGYVPLDPLHGIPASRLAASVGGACYLWSSSGGPRVTDGQGPTRELAIPLDLPGPSPATLVEEGPVRNAFVTYEPESRTVLFVFGKRAYALNIRRPGSAEWSYWELSVEPFCAGLLYGEQGGSTPIGPSTGFPRPLDPSEWPEINDFTAVIRWENVAPIGREILEIWLKPAGGAWTHWANAPVTQDQQFEKTWLGGGTASTGGGLLSAGTTYQLALRYRRANQYAPDYTGATPDDWPAIVNDPSLVVSFTTLEGRPAWGANLFDYGLAWSRLSETLERITLTWRGVNPSVGTRIFKATALEGPYTMVATVSPGVTTYDYDISNDTEGEMMLFFYLEPGDAAGPAPNAVPSVKKKIWVGPSRPLGNENKDSTWSENEAPEVTVSNIETFGLDGEPLIDPVVDELFVRVIGGARTRLGTAPDMPPDLPPWETEIYVKTDMDEQYSLRMVIPALDHFPAGGWSTTWRQVGFRVKARNRVTWTQYNNKQDFSDFGPESAEMIAP